MLKKIKKYILSHKVEIVLLFAILILGAFLRLYRISDYMTFLGDEGRDAIVAKDILRGDFTLLGPRASAGDFFLGPIYYYMMAPFLFLTNLDPVGPAIMVALFGIATIFLVYYVGLKFFNAKAGLFAASLYAVSPLVIAYSRSSWNPNPMPFFSILTLYLLYVAVRGQSQKLFVVAGFLLGIAMQLHYLTTFLGVIIFVFVLLGEIVVQRKGILRRYILHYLELFVGFLVGLSPFLVFEARHGFPNIRTILRFVFEDNASKTYLGTSFMGNVTNVFFRLFARLLMKFPPPEQVNVTIDPYLKFLQIASIILAFTAIIAIFFLKDRLKVLLLSVWLFFGIVLFGFYKQSIYDYYLGFMFPLPFILVGGMLSRVLEIRKYKVGIVFVLIVFLGLFALNLSGNPFRYPPNKQKAQAKNIADFILSKTGGQPFNFALLTKGNSDHVYRYFFEVEDRAPVAILNPSVDPERKSVTSQLLVVCEYADCQPLGNPLWEVAGFGRGKIEGTWEVPFVKVFKLIHYGRPMNYTLKQVLSEPFDEYSNQQYGFSFKYPSTFIQTVENDTRGFPLQPILYLNFRTPEVAQEDKEKPNFDFTSYDNNTMTISIQAFNNPGDLSLDDFLASYFRGSEIDDIRKNLTKSAIPKSDSYVYTGNLGGTPTKRYFVKNQKEIYFLTLLGGNNTRASYTPSAEQIFDVLVKSLKFR